MRHLWMVPLAFIVGGCVNLQTCASYLAEHNDKAISDLEELVRVVPAESPAAPLIQEVHWRLSSRVRPWTSELRRYKGPVVVDVPRSSRDMDALRRENRDLDEFTQEINFAQALEFPAGSQAGGILGLFGGLGATSGLLGVLAVARKVLKQRFGAKDAEIARSRSDAEKADRVRRKLHNIVDSLKARGPEWHQAVESAAGADPEIEISWKQSRLETAKEQQVARQEARRQMPGL